MKRGKRLSTRDLRQMRVVSSRGQHRHQQPLKTRYRSKTLEALFDFVWWSVMMNSQCFNFWWLWNNVSIPQNIQNSPQCLIPHNQQCLPRIVPVVPLGWHLKSPSCAAASADSPPFPPGWSIGSAPRCGRAGRATSLRSLRLGYMDWNMDWNMVEHTIFNMFQRYL